VPVRAYVAVTDRDWYRFLRDRPDLDEVNFWQPGGNRLFRRLKPGEPFLFKLHYPENVIAGGGFFTHASLLDASIAWDAFDQKNGAPSYPEMCRRIEKYRRAPMSPRAQYTIGCIILQEPFFFRERDWIPAPADFSRNIVQGKTYDLASGTGRQLWEAVLERYRFTRASASAEPEGPVLGRVVPVWQRLGQGAFRVLVTDTYERRCAVTREKALPVLEAAHIQPVADGGPHSVSNGLLLRSDVHTLYDRGYVTISPDLRFRVSRRLKKDFDNGEHYYQLDGSTIWVPRGADERPRRELLEWHADTVFRGSTR
jgi:putative restriction endonuclease